MRVAAILFVVAAACWIAAAGDSAPLSDSHPHQHQTHHVMRAAPAHRQIDSPMASTMAPVESRASSECRDIRETVPFTADPARRLQLLDVLRV